ncbi:MAG: 50S ribosomal protein L32 [Bifidobacteriaceae bacterium]|jgi:large subunit ribosomal protein L32|nr:50S ribosomal protein L32 [Bifidobacteriaceae bacterium]
MAVPKFKTSKCRTRSRRANWKAKKISVHTCPQCKQSKIPHIACPTCGTYKGVTYEVARIKSFAK